MFDFLRKKSGLEVLTKAMTWPDRHAIQAHLAERAKLRETTPDVSRLEEYSHQLLFTYDGAPVEGDLVCRAAFTKSNFDLYKRELGEFSYPLAIPNPAADRETHFMDKTSPGHIRGEIHLIDPALLKELDKTKLNGVEFTRCRVKLMIPYRMVKWVKDPSLWKEPVPEANVGGRSIRTTLPRMHVVQTHAYVGKKDYFDPLIDGGFEFTSVPVTTPRDQTFFNKYFFYRQDD